MVLFPVGNVVTTGVVDVIPTGWIRQQVNYVNVAFDVSVLRGN